MTTLLRKIRIYPKDYIITIEKTQVYSNAVQSSDASWYHDTFGMMHRYSCALYRPISLP